VCLSRTSSCRSNLGCTGEDDDFIDLRKGPYYDSPIGIGLGAEDPSSAVRPVQSWPLLVRCKNHRLQLFLRWHETIDSLAACKYEHVPLFRHDMQAVEVSYTRRNQI
jgi:hypothetical protein